MRISHTIIMRTAAVLIVVLLLLSACGSGGEDTPVTAETSAETTSAAEVTTQQLGYEYNIEDEDFGGREFGMLVVKHADYEYVVEEESGDVVEDTVFARNRYVEELLNIIFNFNSVAGYSGADTANFNNIIKNSVLAGDEAYDMVNGLNVFVTSLIIDDCFLNWNNIEGCNLENPWWTPGTPLNGFNGFAFNESSFSMYKDIYVMFFNKFLTEQYKLGDPYSLVKEGGWSLDAFLAMASDASVDVDGNGTIELNKDIVSYVAKHAAGRGYLRSCDCTVFTYHDDGTVEADALSERLVTAYDKLKPYLSDKCQVFVDSQDDIFLLSKPFTNQQAFFLVNCMGAIEGMRDMENDFGIVPLPKYDEAQEEYYSQIATSASALYLPATASDTRLCGLVGESLGYYSYLNVVPTYFDVALGEKYSRDKDTVEMINIIRSSASTNLEFEFASTFGHSANDIFNKAWSGEDIGSYFASKLPTWQAKLEILMAYNNK